MKYLGNRWTDLRQIRTEDVFIPRSDECECQGQRSKVRSPATKNGILGPFGGLRAVYVWWNIFSLWLLVPFDKPSNYHFLFFDCTYVYISHRLGDITFYIFNKKELRDTDYSPCG